MGLVEVYEKLVLTGAGVKIGSFEGNIPGLQMNLDSQETVDQYMMNTYGFNSTNLLHIRYYPENGFDTVDTMVQGKITQFNNDPDKDQLKVVTLIENGNGDYEKPDPQMDESNNYIIIYDGQGNPSYKNIHSHENNIAKVIISEDIGIAKNAVVYATLSGKGNLSQAFYNQFKFSNIEALIKCGMNILTKNFCFSK